jgi:hypothetical protein
MLPHLEGIQTLHVVTHGELHLLPLSTEGMNDIQVRHYPGLVFYWLQSRWDRRLCNPHSLAMQVYSPDHGDMPSPIPFVKAEARLVSSLWHPALSPLPFDQGGEVRVVHLAGHGEVGEGQDSRLLVGPQRTIGPRELLRSQLRPEVVYINACLLGHTSEDLDGDPLGFVSTFLLLGARAVIAPLVPISDVYAPILAALFHWELRQQQERSHVLDAGLALKLAKRGLDQGEWPGEIVRGVREAYIAPFGEMIAAVVAAREASSQQAGEFQADLLQSVRSWLPMCKLVELAKLCSGIVETLLADGPSAAARDGGAQLADLLIQHRARLSQHRGVRHLMMYVQAYGATAEQRRPGGLGGGPHRD